MDEDCDREVQGRVDKTAGKQREGEEKKGQGGVGDVSAGVATKAEQKIQSKNPPRLKNPKFKINPGKSSLANCH